MPLSLRLLGFFVGNVGQSQFFLLALQAVNDKLKTNNTNFIFEIDQYLYFKNLILVNADGYK
jgi:hypothetical protein